MSRISNIFGLILVSIWVPCECLGQDSAFVIVGAETKFVLQISFHAVVHHSEASALSTVSSTLESRDIAPPGDVVVLLAHSFGGSFTSLPGSQSFELEFEKTGCADTPCVPGQPFLTMGLEVLHHLETYRFVYGLCSQSHVHTVGVHLNQLEVTTIHVLAEEVIVELKHS